MRDFVPDASAEFCGLRCHAWENFIGFFCGYVDIPKGSPLYGCRYYDEPLCDVDAHGGLTFSEEEDGVWRIGWDYGHFFDEPVDASRVLEDARRVAERVRELEERCEKGPSTAK